MATGSGSSSAATSRSSGSSRTWPSTRPGRWRCRSWPGSEPAELARILRHAGASVVLCSEVHDEIRSAAPIVVSTGPGGSMRWAELLSARRRRRGAGAQSGRRRRHHVHVGDHRPAEGRGRAAWRALDHRARPVSRGWGSGSSPPRPSPPPAGRSSSAALCAADSAGGSSPGSTRIVGSPPSNVTVRSRRFSCRQWWSSSSALPGSRPRTSRAWPWSTSAAHRLPRPPCGVSVPGCPQRRSCAGTA